MFLANHGAVAVQEGSRRGRRRLRGAPPAAPPGDPGEGGGRGGGGEGGDGSGDGASGADGNAGAGPFALALALAGITTLFVVLLAVWLFLRRPAPDWRATGALHALWISTACLLASSAAVELAARCTPARRTSLKWLLASLALGAAFLAAQVHLWLSLWRAGLVPAASGYAAVLFALTSLHALHVLGGLAFLSTLAWRLHATPPSAARRPSVRLGAVYWHFMGGLWLVLFALLYFVR